MHYKFLFTFLFIINMHAQTYHHPLTSNQKNFYLWEEPDCDPFDELLISWSSERPSKGELKIYASVLQEDWSAELLYAVWGKDTQRTFSSPKEGASVRVFLDAVEVLQGKKARGFRIRIAAENGASLDELRSIHVGTSALQKKSSEQTLFPICVKPALIDLPLDGLSQMALKHPKSAHLCSPTSTTSVVRFLRDDATTDPIQFAEGCLDQGFDIFGNWVLNTAEANHHLTDTDYVCYVQRCTGIEDLLVSLASGLPVVVSVQGFIEGAPLSYDNGHLMVVCGFDPRKEEVICMDPAFTSNEMTKTRYSLRSFEQAWKRRKYLAYIFQKKVHVFHPSKS